MDREPLEQPNHATDEQHGGGDELVQIRSRKEHESPRPRPLPFGFRERMRDDVPPTRAECPADRDARGCPHVHCRHHLWRQDAADRPGRRHQCGSLPPTVLRRYTLESCALDVIDEQPRGVPARAVAALIGVGLRRAEQLVRGAVMKLRAAGVDASEFMALLDAERGESQTAGSPLAAAQNTHAFKIGPGGRGKAPPDPLAWPRRRKA